MRFTNPYSTHLGTLTWAALQAAYPNGGGELAALPTGTTAFVSDWGAQFTPNAAKTTWRSCGGAFVLRTSGGSVATPVATITGATSGIFSLPGGMPPIPAALLTAGASIVVRARCRKNGANGTASLVVRLGTAGTASDSDVLSVAFDNTSSRVISVDANVSVASSSVVGVGAATNRGSDAIQTSVAAADWTTNINTAAAMYMHFAISAANSSDSFGLINYSLQILSDNS